MSGSAALGHAGAELLFGHELTAIQFGEALVDLRDEPTHPHEAAYDWGNLGLAIRSGQVAVEGSGRVPERWRYSPAV